MKSSIVKKHGSLYSFTCLLLLAFISKISMRDDSSMKNRMKQLYNMMFQ